MGNNFEWRGILRRITGGSVESAARRDSGANQPSRPRTVDVELVIQAARLVVTTRLASQALFVRQLYVTESVADTLLTRLEHYEVIAPSEPGKSRRVLTTSGQLPAVIAEFERRG